MCSLTDYDGTPNEIDTSKLEKKIPTICKKCNEFAAVILQKQHSYCRSCFLFLISHKFRSTIGKIKSVRPGDKVLSVFRGNQSSVALLHLLQQGVDGDSRKKIRFVPTILFIDESILWSRGIDVHSVLPEVFTSLKRVGFSCYVTKLSSIYDSHFITKVEDINLPDHFIRNECDAKLLSLFEEITTATSKVALLLELRCRLQYEIAKLLNCDKIFLPECATDLSVRLLSDVALGRGSPASNGVVDCGEKDLSVSCIRPLREITLKEVAFYNLFSSLESANIPSPTVMFDSCPSLQFETESFIYQLQEEFPSTVNTIFRVGDKLKMPERTIGIDGVRCSLCRICDDTHKCVYHSIPDFKIGDGTFLPLSEFVFDTFQSDYTLKIRGEKRPHHPSCISQCGSTLRRPRYLFVHTVFQSLFTPPARNLKHFQRKLCFPNTVDADCSRCKNEIRYENTDEIDLLIAERFCYSCRRIARDLKSPNRLLDSLILEANLPLVSETMRTAIEDFLL